MARTAPHSAEGPAAAAAHYTEVLDTGAPAVGRMRAAAAAEAQPALGAAGSEVAENKTAQYSSTRQAAAVAGVPCFYRRSMG